MKRLTTLLLTAIMALSLAACAGMHKEEATRVKCPACGYEFKSPMGG